MFSVKWKLSRHTGWGGGPGQCHQMTHGGEEGPKIALKILRIIWMAPKVSHWNFSRNFVSKINLLWNISKIDDKKTFYPGIHISSFSKGLDQACNDNLIQVRFPLKIRSPSTLSISLQPKRDVVFQTQERFLG
jgi:hypothetical protein